MSYMKKNYAKRVVAPAKTKKSHTTSQVTSPKQPYPCLSFNHTILGILAFHDTLPQDSQSKGHHSESQDALVALYLPAFYLLLLSLAPPSFKNPYCTGFKPGPDSKQYRHLQPRQSSKSWKYCPGTDSGREAYFKDLCDLLCRLLKWKKADQGPRGTCGQTEGICLISYFLSEEQESGVDTYHHSVFGLIITCPCICQEEE